MLDNMINEPGMMNVSMAKMTAYQKAFGVAKSGKQTPMFAFSRYGATLKNGGIAVARATIQPHAKP